mmetsp:Transcript_23581/g.75196  ORF Transcript_23581/g.75196 Transcript_23581/m.75196 type:complete len:228 (+) Transcript_23581:1232-1915(+)
MLQEGDSSRCGLEPQKSAVERGLVAKVIVESEHVNIGVHLCLKIVVDIPEPCSVRLGQNEAHVALNERKHQRGAEEHEHVVVEVAVSEYRLRFVQLQVQVELNSIRLAKRLEAIVRRLICADEEGAHQNIWHVADVADPRARKLEKAGVEKLQVEEAALRGLLCSLDERTEIPLGGREISVGHAVALLRGHLRKNISALRACWSIALRLCWPNAQGRCALLSHTCRF